MARGLPDPFSVTTVPVRVIVNDLFAASTNKIVLDLDGQPTLPASMHAALQLEKVNAQQELNKSLLRLTFLMQQSEWLLCAISCGMLGANFVHNFSLRGLCPHV